MFFYNGNDSRAQHIAPRILQRQRTFRKFQVRNIFVENVGDYFSFSMYSHMFDWRKSRCITDKKKWVLENYEVFEQTTNETIIRTIFLLARELKSWEVPTGVM